MNQLLHGRCKVAAPDIDKACIPIILASPDKGTSSSERHRQHQEQGTPTIKTQTRGKVTYLGCRGKAIRHVDEPVAVSHRGRKYSPGTRAAWNYRVYSAIII